MNDTIFKKELLTMSLTVMLVCIVPAVQAVVVPPDVQLAAKQEIIINNGTEVQTLDPHKAEGVPESTVIRNLIEGLTQHDVNGHTIAGVAERWESKDDNKVWIFHLRPDAKWSNGTPLTANDFVYSWQRIVDPNTASPYASYLQYAHVLNAKAISDGIQDKSTLGVKALDAHTFEVTLSEAVPYLPDMTSHNAMKPAWQPTIEKYGDKWTQPKTYIGNGAYQLDSWVVNDHITLVRNPYYWDNQHTIIDKVTILPITSGIASVNRYRAGELDMDMGGVPIELFQSLKKDIPDQLKINSSLCTYYYEINNSKPPFTDERIREALKLSLDRDIIVYKILNQGQTPAYGFTPPYIDGGKFTPPEWISWSQQKRDERAKQLLSEAGYGPGNPLTFTLLYNTLESHKKLAIAAASIWKKSLGVNVKLENQEWKTFLDSRHEGNFDVSRAGWCADYNEPSSFLNTMLSYSSNNTTKYKSAAFDKIISGALLAPDAAARAEVYQQAEQQLDKNSAIIPVYHYVNVSLVKPYVGGYTGKDPLNYIYIKDLYIIKH